MIVNPAMHGKDGGVNIGAPVEITVVNKTSETVYLYPQDAADGQMHFLGQEATTKVSTYMGQIIMLAASSGTSCNVTNGDASVRASLPNHYACVMGEGVEFTIASS